MEEGNVVVITVSLVIALLIIAAGTYAFAKKYKLPYTVILVIVAILLGNLNAADFLLFEKIKEVALGPEFILFVCLPTLLFESAFYLDFKKLQENLSAVLALAIPGLLISTFIIGLLTYLMTPLSLPISLLIGSILSATDPVAVISLFKAIGASKRLTVLVEGESLLNDATAIVMAKIILLFLMTGNLTTESISHGFVDFLFEFFGGIAVGLAVAAIFGTLLGFVREDPFIEISLVSVIAYLSFLIADQIFHFSGVMATVMAGVVMGGWGYTKISPQVAAFLKQFLEFMVFIIQSAIFFIVGLSTNISLLLEKWWLVLVVIFAMLISRAAVILGLIPLLNKISKEEQVGGKYQIVMWWGGLRGAIALAIVLSLEGVEEKESIMAIVTGAVLFTLIVQGLTIEQVVNWLGLNVPSVNEQLAKLEIELIAEENSTKQIEALQKGGLFSLNIASHLGREQSDRISLLKSQIETVQSIELNREKELQRLFLNCCYVEKSRFYELFSQGHFSEQVYRHLINKLNSTLDDLSDEKSFDLKRRSKDYIKKYFQRAGQFWEPSHLLENFSQRFRTKRLFLEYEIDWAYQQASLYVVDYLSSSEVKENFKEALQQEALSFYRDLNGLAKNKLDSIAEQFPEFVSSMQMQLGKRLMLLSKQLFVKDEAKRGVIQEQIAERIEESIVREICEMQKPLTEGLKLDPHEIIRKVPFLANLTSEQAKKIVPLLKPQFALTDEAIILQGSEGSSLYLIARGVVRVEREGEGGEKIALATLIAGDFFGEGALLHSTKRTATCRAVTPCALFKLERKTFEYICSQNLDIVEAIYEIDRKRQIKERKR